MRSQTFIYINNGTTFGFNPEQMTDHPYYIRPASMLQVHALLTQEDPQNRKVMDGRGRILSRYEIRHAARTGRMPERQHPQQ